MWIVVVCAFIAGIIIGALLIFMHFYRNKDCGKKFFEDSEKPFNKKAPEMYYHKQRMFRLGYGFWVCTHYILLIMSISFTIVTIYMVMDEELNLYVRIIVSVMAAITTTLQIILRCDKISEGYICAMRIMEQAILEYETIENETLEILLQANIKAEEVIHNMFQ